MDERRLFLFLILAFLVLAVYPLLFPSAKPQAPVAAAPSSTPVVSATPFTQAPAAAAPPAVSLATVEDTGERRVEVVTPDAAVAFTNRGARLLSWRLAKFNDERGRPEEMVAVAANGPRPLDVETGDAGTDALLRDALYKVSSENLDLQSGSDGTLVFEYSSGNLAARKTFVFHGGRQLVDVTVSVSRNGQELDKRLVWGPGIGVPSEAERAVRGYQPPQAVALVGREVTRVPPGKLKQRTSLGDARWTGVEGRYFVALLAGGEAGVHATEAFDFDVPLPGEGKSEARVVTGLVLGDRTGPVVLYVGAKDYFSLKGLGQGFEEVVPVGSWIGPIVIPLMRLLRWVHGYVGNYGWSIVLLTVLINAVMGPFRHFSIVNGIKMAKIAPEMRAIQARYKKVPLMERQQMQEEINALYARHGLSMGTQMTVGCLPMLLTMPFFFAFYRVIDISIELRGAPFLWIPDLSQKDPYFLSPILMAVSMFALQKMTPAAVDPAQQRMMMLMPLIFVVFLFWAAAGLNIYWLASNCCAVIQQGVTLRLVKHGTGDAKRGDRKR